MQNNDNLESVHKTIDLIQNIIKRMSTTSLIIKGWTLTLVTILTIFSVYNNISINYNMLLLVAVLFLIFIMWNLDTFFVHTERIYRVWYDFYTKESKHTSRYDYLLNIKIIVSILAKEMQNNNAFIIPTKKQVYYSNTLYSFYSAMLGYTILLIVIVSII